MKYTQRDIVEINFLFPDGESKPHPALIVSNNDLQETEGFIYLCLISSKPYNPEYCFPIEDEMLTFKMSKKSYVKCQLLVANIDRDVLRKFGKIKEPYFSKVVEKIKESIF